MQTRGNNLVCFFYMRFLIVFILILNLKLIAQENCYTIPIDCRGSSTICINGYRGGFPLPLCVGECLKYVVISDTCSNQRNMIFTWYLYNKNSIDTFYGKEVEICFGDSGLFAMEYIYGKNKNEEDNGGNKARRSVRVNPCPPVANFDSDKQAICTGDCVQFTDRSTRLPKSWQWEFDGGSPATYTGQYPPPICYIDTGSFEVRLRVQSPYGVDDTLITNYISVKEAPAPRTVPLSFDIKEGDEITLEACAAPINGVWQPNAFVVSKSDTLLTILPDESISYTYTATSPNGCVRKCTYTIAVQRGLLIPTAFSPNADGMNDAFRILNTNIQLLSFSVFNRWGQQVFDTKNQADGWDGSFLDVPQPIGVYTWTAQYKILKTGKRKSVSGNVTLVR